MVGLLKNDLNKLLGFKTWPVIPMTHWLKGRICERVWGTKASTTEITLDSADGGKSSYHFVRVYERQEE